mgnify:CR=1 FL=1
MSLDQNLDKILIIDFGSQFTQLIARRVRENNVFSEILSPDTSLKAIVLKKCNSHFYMSEICLKIIYMGYIFKEVKVNYFQRPWFDKCFKQCDHTWNQKQTRPRQQRT